MSVKEAIFRFENILCSGILSVPKNENYLRIFNIRAGLPPITENGGKSLVTTLPPPTTVPVEMVRPGIIKT
ncbi:MAG: hypothetical protein J6T35_02765, partial [Bacteroidales bacterium]|nr:hypothetical protein [Bacteroidales bacterium]